MLQRTLLLMIIALLYTDYVSTQPLPCQLTGGTRCPTRLCPGTPVNYFCNVTSYDGYTVCHWNTPPVGVYNASILTLAQDDLNTSNATYGPFTVTNTPPFTNISYYIISILTVVITSEMDGLVLSCSSQNLLQPPFTINPVGNVTISLIAPPSTPNITSLASPYQDQLMVIWTSVPTATSYNVSIMDDSNILSTITITNGSQQHTFTGVIYMYKSDYTISVVAKNCAGASNSAKKKIKTEIDLTVNIAVVAGTVCSILGLCLAIITIISIFCYLTKRGSKHDLAAGSSNQVRYNARSKQSTASFLETPQPQLAENEILNKECSQRHLMSIAQYGFDWKTIGRRLIREQDVDDIDSEERTDVLKRQKVLLKWAEQQGSGATYKKLADVLKKVENHPAAKKVLDLASH